VVGADPMTLPDALRDRARMFNDRWRSDDRPAAGS
jgi:hypothetical protein